MTDNLPIEHLSYSSLRTFLDDRYMFFRQYILKDFYSKSKPAGLSGKGFHKFVENFYNGVPLEKAKTLAIEHIDKTPDKEVDWGKTGSRESVIKTCNTAIEFWLAEEPDLGETLFTEKSVTTNFQIGDMTSPLPLKAVTDRITKLNGKIHLWDYKTCTAFTDTEKESGKFILQAMFNYYTVKYGLNLDPYSFTFVEIKTSKNKDSSSQIQKYEIVFGDHPEYETIFLRLYAGLIQELARDEIAFLPNPSAMFTAQDSWEEFAKGEIGFEMPKQISHKPINVETTPTKTYISSEVYREEFSNLDPEEKIKVKLGEFGIPLRFVDKAVGANVTLYRYELSARGVPITKAGNYDSDIAAVLESESVRILAPIPKTKYLGIEVSNQSQTIVSLPQLEVTNSLRLPLGVDVYGKDYSIDLAKAPHLLISGTTGSGKSVCIHNIITSLIQQNHESELQLVIIDPKMEFAQFANHSHVMGVVDEMDSIYSTFEWAISKMNERYKILKENPSENMSKIVIIIDELNDLLMAPGGDLNESMITRLAQKARGAGIHLVVATQNPIVKVLSSNLKANLPTRICFKVSQRVNSQVVLDEVGAEKLSGNGDMLVLNPTEKGIIRLQGYFNN